MLVTYAAEIDIRCVNVITLNTKQYQITMTQADKVNDYKLSKMTNLMSISAAITLLKLIN